MEEQFFEYISQNPMQFIQSEQERVNYKVSEEMAKYQFHHGKSIMEIDYLELEQQWEMFLKGL